MSRIRLLVTGASGNLGQTVLAVADRGAVEVVPSGRRSPPEGGVLLDLADPASIAPALNAARPDAVLHLAAITRPAWAEEHRAETFRVNRDGSAALARACRARGLRLVAVSTDLVFPGRRGGLYREEDAPLPLSIYGRSKLAAEQAVLGECPGALVVRTSLLLARGRDHVARLESDLAGPGATLYTDEWRSPILAADLGRALIELLVTDAQGVLHLGGPERMTRFELGVVLARALGLDPARIHRGSRVTAPPPPRPDDVSLDSSRAIGRLARTRIRTVAEGAQDLRTAGAR
jgi:dTDP-4-dehydrorhamnose reductase